MFSLQCGDHRLRDLNGVVFRSTGVAQGASSIVIYTADQIYYLLTNIDGFITIYDFYIIFIFAGRNKWYTHKKTKCQGIKGLGEISYRIGCRFLKIHSRCPGRISVGAFSIACICFFPVLYIHLLISIKQTFFFFILCCLFAWAHKYFIGIFQKKKRKPLRFFWLIKNNVICHERDFI